MTTGVLRIALLGVLLSLALLWRSATDRAAVILSFDVDDVAGMLRTAATGAPLLIVRDIANAPTPFEISALSALSSGGAAIAAALPEAAPMLIAGPPPPLRAGRSAGLPFRVAAAPGDTVRIALGDVAGALDSVRVGTDAHGIGTGAFRVEPQREGWHEWTVARVDGSEADAGGARVGGWARGPVQPRVLVAAGPPSWETRFLVRALEESAVRVTVQQSLARGVSLGDEAAGAWTSATLDAYDVVILMPDAFADAQRIEALRSFGTDGGGVLLAGAAAAAAAFGLASDYAIGPAAGEDGTHLGWTLPAGVVELPPADFASDVAAFERPAPGVLIGATHRGRPALLLAAIGRGRTAAIGLAETWRWRMQAGRIAEHRAFWRSLVDWAAAGREAIVVEPERTIVSLGEAVRVALHPSTAELPEQLILRRPTGEEEMLVVAAGGDASVAHFVPVDMGVHTLAVDDEVIAAVRSVPEPPASPDAWSKVARLAEASGGFAVPASDVDEAIEAWRTRTKASSDRPAPSALLLVLIVALAYAEWALRRLRGKA